MAHMTWAEEDTQVEAVLMVMVVVAVVTVASTYQKAPRKLESFWRYGSTVHIVHTSFLHNLIQFLLLRQQFTQYSTWNHHFITNHNLA
jgi:hypothetical protein